MATEDDHERISESFVCKFPFIHKMWKVENTCTSAGQGCTFTSLKDTWKYIPARIVFPTDEQCLQYTRNNKSHVEPIFTAHYFNTTCTLWENSPHYLYRTLCTTRVYMQLRIRVYSNIQNTITRMMNFHNPALVRTVTFNFAESYQNVTMLRILMSDAQHKHVSYVVLT